MKSKSYTLGVACSKDNTYHCCLWDEEACQCHRGSGIMTDLLRISTAEDTPHCSEICCWRCSPLTAEDCPALRSAAATHHFRAVSQYVGHLCVSIAAPTLLLDQSVQPYVVCNCAASLSWNRCASARTSVGASQGLLMAKFGIFLFFFFCSILANFDAFFAVRSLLLLTFVVRSLLLLTYFPSERVVGW